MGKRIGKKAKKADRTEREFRVLALAQARRSLGQAIEWVDCGDEAAALQWVRRAIDMLEASREEGLIIPCIS